MKRWLEGSVVLPDRVIENGLVAFEGATITGVWDLEAVTRPDGPDSRTTTKVDGYIAPGFIDIHVHGGGNADFMDGDPEAVAAITATHARYGTTSMLATTLTASEPAIVQAIKAVKAAPRRGARIVGFHIEGPFINLKMKGAQDGRYVRPATVAELDRILALGDEGDRWHFTIAPEIPGHHEAIAHLVGKGAVVSVGHTECTYAQLEEAVKLGLSHATHLYNAMKGLHHREPGTVGGALTLPGITAELIADGIHVHPVAMKVAVAARGHEHILLVTDAMEAAGMPEGGEYRLGELATTVKDGAVRLADGTLAGSVLTMAHAVRNMVKLVGVDLPAAVAMASLNPARKHRLDGRKGAIAAGLDADLVLLDKQLTVTETIVEGEVVYTAR